MVKQTDKDLYGKIVKLKSLKPSIKVNRIFSELVAFALDSDSSTSLAQDKLAKLQKICSLAEYELEKYWAKKILKSKEAYKTINQFPYLNNYKKLTQMEWFSLLSCTEHNEHKILFVGGGPLPLTAIVLSMNYDVNLTVLDSDGEACELARSLIKKLGLKAKIKIIKSDARDFDYYKDFNVIVVAALAGVEKGVKSDILQKIKFESKKGSHILARSSWGMREILYKPLDRELYKLFKPVVEVRPQNDVVNSLVIFANE